jgi:hypothetical protein
MFQIYFIYSYPAIRCDVTCEIVKYLDQEEDRHKVME